MKLFRFNGGRIGVTSKDVSYDLTEALGIDTRMWPPVQMVALIAEFDKRMAGVFENPNPWQRRAGDAKIV